MCFSVDLKQKKKKTKKKYCQHPFFAIFLSKAKTKIIKKVVQMNKGAIITHIS